MTADPAGSPDPISEHTPQKWYVECDCVHPDDDPATESIPDADYALLVDQFEDAHTNLYEDGEGQLMGRGCEKSYTDTRCAVCSISGDYPDVPWPCPTAAAEGASS